MDEQASGWMPDRIEHACRSLGIRLLILFGSRSDGRRQPRPESDVDLGVLVTARSPC